MTYSLTKLLGLLLLNKEVTELNTFIINAGGGGGGGGGGSNDIGGGGGGIIIGF